jgi:hypothetical protein
MQQPIAQKRHPDENSAGEFDKRKLPWQAPRLNSLPIDATEALGGSGADSHLSTGP